MSLFNKPLVLLDLDHTIIYGSYAESETAELLFSYSSFLKVYKRPGVEKLIEILNNSFEVVVCTTALRKYAIKSCKLLKLNYSSMYSRKNCKRSKGGFKKALPKEFYYNIDRIIIIDDSPDVWDDSAHQYCNFIVPKEFHGDINDKEIDIVIDKLKTITS